LPDSEPQADRAASVPRFYCPDLPKPSVLSGSDAYPYSLPADEARHASQVLRLKSGDTVQLFNGRGTTADAAIDQAGKRQVRVAIQKMYEAQPRQPRVSVAAAIPKGDRARDLVDQLSQAGADELIPLRTERSVSDLSPNKQARLERVAVEAAKQCGRDFVLQLADAATLETLLQAAGDETTVLLADPQGERSLGAWSVGDGRGVLILVGPEGGWSPGELERVEAAGVRRGWLGPHVMRIETAAVVATALVRFHSRGGESKPN